MIRLFTPDLSLKSLPRSHSESQKSSQQYTRSRSIAISKKNLTFAVRFKTQQGWGNSFSAKPSPRAPPSGKHPLCFLEANHRDAVMASFYISKAVIQYCTNPHTIIPHDIPELGTHTHLVPPHSLSIKITAHSTHPLLWQ